MGLIDWGQLSAEWKGSEQVWVMKTLIRSNLYHGADNRPAILVLTDKIMYIGGTDENERKFNRIPFKSIIEYGKKGTLMWACVSIRHIDIEGEKKIFLCPYEGESHMPKIDYPSMEKIIAMIEKHKQDECDSV